MRLRRRRRFVDLVERQLRLFADEHAGLIRDSETALRAYNTARGDEAEDRYGDFLDLVETGREELERIRDSYAETLAGEAVEEYEAVFNELARKRVPRFGLELD
jgi:hypothetical protein